MQVPPEATVAAFGEVVVDRKRYAPLGPVRATVTGRGRGRADSVCHLKACDAAGKVYFDEDLRLKDNHGEAGFSAAGALGVHRLFLSFAGAARHSRYVCFLVDCQTAIAAGDPDFDDLLPLTRESLLLNRREHVIGDAPAYHAMEQQTDRTAAEGVRGRIVGYISADTAEIDGLWLRDSVYTLPAYKHWEPRTTELLDRFMEAQREDGSVPDGIRRDGSTWKMEAESDNEYILVTGIHDTWRVTGDDAWMARALPAAERALSYATNDPERWDPARGLAKRRHTCDTWDFGMRVSDTEALVAATCDQTGYYRAFLAMAAMLERLERRVEASAYLRRAAGLRRLTVSQLWGGRFFRHHLHLTEVSHGSFDESSQLAMGNVWTITRGLATEEQASSIVAEYRRRHAQTGDAFPWWSLQPGYPDELGYFAQPFLRQGGYANGGLLPFVGGELCRGAFWSGQEGYGVELLRAYAGHLRATGGRVQVWYWPDGTPGFRTPNEVPHTGWGMAQWLEALVEGLAGIRDSSAGMAEVDVSPRWAAAGIDEATVVVRYAAGPGYFAYRIGVDRGRRRVTIQFTGSGARARFRCLLPVEWAPESLIVRGVAAPFAAERAGASVYACFDVDIAGSASAVLQCAI